MIPINTPGKKKLFVVILLILLVTGTGILARWPAEGKKVATPPVFLLDSTTLLNHLAFLTSPATAGRETGTPGNILVQQYIVRKMDSLQLLTMGDTRLQPFPAGKEQQGNNITGLIKGTKYPDSYIVLSAHYDHLGTHNGHIYFGADDNASGSAALLTMAQYFKNHPPQHSLLLVAFDAEEKGLVGSRYFADHSPVPLSSIQVNVNMDMIGRNDKNEIYICGTYHYPFLKKYTDSIQSFPPVHVLLGHDNPAAGSDDWTTQSDHYAFHKHEIPFLYFGVEDHPDYHKPSDTFEKIQKSFYYRVSNIVAQTVMLLDRPATLQ